MGAYNRRGANLFVVVPFLVAFREYKLSVVAHSEGVLFLYNKARFGQDYSKCTLDESVLLY